MVCLESSRTDLSGHAATTGRQVEGGAADILRGGGRPSLPPEDRGRKHMRTSWYTYTSTLGCTSRPFRASIQNKVRSKIRTPAAHPIIEMETSSCGCLFQRLGNDERATAEEEEARMAGGVLPPAPGPRPQEAGGTTRATAICRMTGRVTDIQLSASYAEPDAVADHILVYFT